MVQVNFLSLSQCHPYRDIDQLSLLAAVGWRFVVVVCRPLDTKVFAGPPQYLDVFFVSPLICSMYVYQKLMTPFNGDSIALMDGSLLWRPWCLHGAAPNE